jgi:dTDP-4-dehydrorhamnose reductase
MILVIGANGYVGTAICSELLRREIEYVTDRHYLATDHILNCEVKYDLVINCAAFIPQTSVAECDKFPSETMKGNVILPAKLAHACDARSIPLAHISTGCLWSDGREHREDDTPDRAFAGHCGFYIGTKVLAETMVQMIPRHYIWRIRLPFDYNLDNPRNYLRKLILFDEVFDHENSLSHLGDFARACLDMVALQAPYGTYNVVNSGSIKATDIVKTLKGFGVRISEPRVVPGPQGGTRLNVAKLLSTGVKIRSVEEAIIKSLNEWDERKHV